MKKELIYLWINKDINNCFDKQGFNFSPEYHVTFDYNNRIVKITETDGINIFAKENIVNISALIGENGTGKTTLLNFITTLMFLPSFQSGVTRSQSSLYNGEFSLASKKFLLVYKHGHEIKIVNCLEETVNFHGRDLHPGTTNAKSNAENFIGQVSRIYITNSEYASNSNMYAEGAEYFSLNNSALESQAKSFYEKAVNLPNALMGGILNTKYNALQSAIIKCLNNRIFQSVLDVYFYGKKVHRNEDFIGKPINDIQVEFTSVLDVLGKNAEKLSLNYQTKLISTQIIETRINKFIEQAKRITSTNNKLVSSLINNLFFELKFCYGFRMLYKQTEDQMRLFERSKKFIESDRYIKDEKEKRYYQTAIREIERIIYLTSNSCTNNGWPSDDGAYQERCKLGASDLFQLIIKDYDFESFITKYLRIVNLDMSSGERALLNIMSRLEFAQEHQNFSNLPQHKSSIKNDVLILIDEIDLYIHPDWQRQLLSELIKEVNRTFYDKSVQIILSSHSPIVLSDIPKNNVLLLEKNKAKITVKRCNRQTFGAGIHTLFKDAFFIKDGLGIGQFAKTYINDLIKTIQQTNNNSEELQKKIDLIGEPLIKSKIQQLLNDKGSSKTIVKFDKSERQELIVFLRQQVAALEKQIEALSGDDHD